MVSHHLPTDTLVEFAAGTLAEGMALVAASHISLCPSCLERTDALNEVGGSLLSDMPAVDFGDDDFNLAELALDRPEPTPMPVAFDQRTRELIPGPLRQYLAGNLADLPWRRLGRSLSIADLALSKPGVTARLLRMQRGRAMPMHTHKGNEFTLVLDGGFSDDSGHYGRGDLAVCRPDQHHKPAADEDGECLCLTVIDAPVKVSGALGWVVNPFFRF